MSYTVMLAEHLACALGSISRHYPEEYGVKLWAENNDRFDGLRLKATIMDGAEIVVPVALFYRDKEASQAALDEGLLALFQKIENDVAVLHRWTNPREE